MRGASKPYNSCLPRAAKTRRHDERVKSEWVHMTKKGLRVPFGRASSVDAADHDQSHARIKGMPRKKNLPHPWDLLIACYFSSSGRTRLKINMFPGSVRKQMMGVCVDQAHACIF